ncbi:NAD(P)(+)--arginine ADP-ribosyltransferase 1-like [Chanodichthys erythropterus]|uniref:NAD(P)(+)--arginine ADP-ribosyltransferase 1-like n=1 Tax=Chanodichthys erythropterus TaxID=933992 RepID=UPI00351EEE37
MLLIVEALLLISAVLAQDNRTADDERPIYPFDMAENSVDDKFYWCTKKMEYRVQTEFLKKELSNSPTFAEAWKRAEQNHTAPGDNLSKNHSVAIYAYTGDGVHVDFNEAIRFGKQKYKNETYTHYSLHFWLTEAIQILKKTQTKCFNTYRGTTVQFDMNVKGKEVCFGQFTSSTLECKLTEVFGNTSCFEIRTCSGADVTKYSSVPHEKEVLIPPYETFKVIDVKHKAEQKDLWCETVYILESYKTRRFVNCAVANSGDQVVFFNGLFMLTFLLLRG